MEGSSKKGLFISKKLIICDFDIVWISMLHWSTKKSGVIFEG